NSIFHQNNSIASGTEIINGYNASTEISYSILDKDPTEVASPNLPSMLGTGNKIITTPLFVSAPPGLSVPNTAGDFRLLPHSPAIDMGDPDTDLSRFYQRAGMAVDLDLLSREVNGTIDIGAYEW